MLRTMHNPFIHGNFILLATCSPPPCKGEHNLLPQSVLSGWEWSQINRRGSDPVGRVQPWACGFFCMYMLDIPMLLIKSAKSHHHQQMVTNSSCLQHLMFTVTTMKIAAQEVTFWGWQWRVTKINLVFVNHKHMK